jgi:hypothetical protein
MTFSKLARRLLQCSPILLALFLLLGDGKPAAAEEVSCFRDLRNCYTRAAMPAYDWLEMWLYGLDCELTFIDCTRRALIGR